MLSGVIKAALKSRGASAPIVCLGMVYDFPYFDVYFVGRPFNFISAALCGLLRCESGDFAAGNLASCARPEKPLKLYEYEACPFCRKVREALCTLDLDVEVYPCPKPALLGKYGSADTSSRYRSVVADPAGTTRFPVLVDDNRGGLIRGSEAIVAHLWSTYGAGATPPWNYRVGRLLDGFPPLFMLPNILRPLPRHGLLRQPSKVPSELLVLWGYEPSPFVKLVREALSCLELPYVYKTVPLGGLCKREVFRDKYGTKMRQHALRTAAGLIQVPMLQDPNQGGEPIFESAAIVRYLHETYGAPAVKGE